MNKKSSPQSSGLITGICLSLLFSMIYKLMGDSLFSSILLGFLGGISGGFIVTWWNTVTPSPSPQDFPPNQDKIDILAPSNLIKNKEEGEPSPQNSSNLYPPKISRKLPQNRDQFSGHTLSLFQWFLKSNKPPQKRHYRP